MSKKFYFLCKSNRNAPPLVLESPWEAKDMREHPDYEEVTENGELVPQEDPIEGTIPFNGSGGRK